MKFVSADHWLVQEALYNGEVRFVRDENGKLVDLEAEGRRRKAYKNCVESLDRMRGERPVLPDPRG